MTALGGVNGTVCNAQQYRQSLQSYNSRSPSISCLTHGDSIGLVLAAETSSLSCICAIVMFIWIGRNVYWYKKTFPGGDWELFKGPVDIYMFLLFLFDILQAAGGILNIKWAHNGIVTTGPYCTVQGIIQQAGELGVALITLLLALHTFIAAVLPARDGLNARAITLGLVCLACVYIGLCVGINAGIHNNYDTPTPYWCWISPQYPGERLAGEYVWLWIALFASVILYIPLCFWAEGYWSIDEGYRFHWPNPDQRFGSAKKRATLGMLFYPLAYSLVVLPISVARWLRFRNHPVSPAVTFFANSIFYLSGAINVTLFLIVRPELLLFPRPEELAEPVIELAPSPQRASTAILSDTEMIQQSPGRTSAALGDEGPRDNATSSDVRSRRISGESDI